jgi:hypothetical protein
MSYHSEAREFTPVCNGVRVNYSIFSFLYCVLYLIVCPFVLFLAIELYVLRFVVSDYPIGVFKHFFLTIYSKSFSTSFREGFRYQWWTPDKCKLIWKYMTRDYHVLCSKHQRYDTNIIVQILVQDESHLKNVSSALNSISTSFFQMCLFNYYSILGLLS